MPKFVDITGHRYGRLFAVRYVGRAAHGKQAWQCICDCGKSVEATSNVLRRRTTMSCGCLAREVAVANGRLVGARTGAKNGKAGAKHGHTSSAATPRTATYRSWQAMKDRCDRPTRRSSSYAGIAICDRWRDYRNFLADMGERPDGTSLDRINPFGNYEPGNCRWATRAVQVENTRRHWIKREQAGAFA